MGYFRSLLLTTVLVFSACQSVAPTPVLIGGLKAANNKTIALYMSCSDGPNYVVEKEGCDPVALENQTVSTMELAKNFISADIKQSAGYDIYLQTALIYFRIGERNTQEYSEAERIARQFFEVQKATSGRALTSARFYWVVITAGHASWQWYNDRLSLDADRKVELLLCYAEGNVAFQEIGAGPRKIRLKENLQVLKSITDVLP